MLVGNRVGVGLYILLSFLNAQLREQVNNARRAVSTLWHGPGNIHGFILDAKCFHVWCEDSNLSTFALSPIR